MGKKGVLRRDEWTATASNHHGPRPPKNIIDGNPQTHWHARFGGNSPKHPHEVCIDMGRKREVRGFQYLPRQAAPQNGRIKGYEFYVSADGRDWGKPVARGAFPDKSDEQEVTFTPTRGRHVRMVAISGYDNPWAIIAELNVLGK